MSKLPLTVVINTKNAETTLSKALESIADIATQIVVMDMKSDDKTRQVAEKFTSEVYKTEKDFEFVEPARNAALAKAKEEWILILDADEEISKGLKKEIIEIIEEHKSEADCFFIPRRNIIFGKEMTGTGWWPDYQMRLFRKDKVTWFDQIHSVPEIHGKVEHLAADSEKAILHHNIQKVDQYLNRLNRYTTIEASVEGKDGKLSPAIALHVFKDEFLRRLFQQKGIDEGIHGVSLSLLQSSYQLITMLKKWEKAGFFTTESDQKQTIKELRIFQSDLNFWIADWQVNHSNGIGKIAWQVRRRLRL